MRSLLLNLLILLSIITANAQEHELSVARRNVRTSTDIVNISMASATVVGLIITRDWEGLKQGALSAATAVGVSYVLKYSIKKDRPDHSDTHSFPSNHSAVAFTNAGFLMKRYGWKLGAPAYALACYTAWGRTYARRHDWWDVAAGAAIGSAAAYIFTTPFARKHSVAIAPFAAPHICCLTASMTF